MGSFSESCRVFDPQALQEVVEQLAGKLQPMDRHELLKQLPGKLTLVDSTVIDTLCKGGRGDVFAQGRRQVSPRLETAG
jgi:hypothetical protein